MRSSITIVFSWWQCSGRSRASRAYRTRVPPQSSAMPFRTVARVGRKSGSGAPAHASTRTSTRSESSASRLRSTTGFEPRTSPKSGEKCQPARCTCELAAARSECIRVAACSPSISTSSEQSGRGGGSPGLQSLPSAASAPPCPSRSSRRRWCAATELDTAAPMRRSTPSRMSSARRGRREGRPPCARAASTTPRRARRRRRSRASRRSAGTSSSCGRPHRARTAPCGPARSPPSAPSW